MNMDAVQLDFFADDPNNRPMLLSALGEGIQNDCGVYVKNVLCCRTTMCALVYALKVTSSSTNFRTKREITDADIRFADPATNATARTAHISLQSASTTISCTE